MRSCLASVVLALGLVGACGGKPTPKPEPDPEPGVVECPAGECGPALGMPSQQCSDGSIGGNTGRCLRQPDDSCGWEIRECPPTVTDCTATGCSGTVCAETTSDLVTTCEMKPEYACYRDAVCERQPSGACGWTPTPELAACLANPPTM
jgi:hypothetical protein